MLHFGPLSIHKRTSSCAALIPAASLSRSGCSVAYCGCLLGEKNVLSAESRGESYGVGSRWHLPVDFIDGRAVPEKVRCCQQPNVHQPMRASQPNAMQFKLDAYESMAFGHITNANATEVCTSQVHCTATLRVSMRPRRRSRHVVM